MKTKSLYDEIVQLGKPMLQISDLAPLIDTLGSKRIVMLGESTHGTHEFYDWRSLISKELIRNYGFNFIAVEGDWPSCERINQFINGKTDDIADVMGSFSRWPTWMWANSEIMDLMDDLLLWNNQSGNKVGFHGLDVYSLQESLEEVVKILERIEPRLAARAKELYACFDPYKHDERTYIRSLYKVPEGCQAQALKALNEILQSNLEDGPQILDAVQNARIIRNAEKYYRVMISQTEDSWNVRDRHMMETLNILMEHYAPHAKCIVWAHNTHIGDYRATDMLSHGQVNLGGLARELYGEEDVALVGFTTFKGRVIASHAWDGPIQVLDVPEGKTGSLERELHYAVNQVGHPNFYLDFNALEDDSSFYSWIGHRAIGVVYYPDQERRGNYVATVPAFRYDAMIFFDETSALSPLDMLFDHEKMPDTYPFGSRL